MIVKDEEAFIEQCLDRVAPVVDEMIVYDTGSTDRTIELAEAKGARVIRGYWDDDFGRARNAALEHCHGEWILHVDADELIEFDRRKLLGGLGNAGGLDVLHLEIRNASGDRADFSHWNRRLFRRKRCHWDGHLHERVVSRDQRPLREARLEDCVITHLGYAGDVVAERDKAERNVRIAQHALDRAGDGPDRCAALINLGRSLTFAHRPAEAFPCYEMAVEAGGNPNEHLFALRLGAEHLVETGAYAQAADWIDQYETAGGDERITAWLRGSIDLLTGKDPSALAAMADLDELVGRDGMGVPTHRLRMRTAMALAATRQWAKAVPALLDLLNHDPTLGLWGVTATCAVEAGADLDAIVAAIPEQHLRTVLAQIVREPAAIAEAMGQALLRRFGDDARIVGFAVHHAERLDDLEVMLPWATLIRAAGLTERCPVIARTEDPTVPVPDRFMAAVIAHAAFRDPRAAGALDRLAALLSPADEPAAIHLLQELAPDLLVTET